MSSTVDEDYLRKQVMIGQFVNVVGCTSEQALQMLQSAQWNYEVAFSLFFQDHHISPHNAVVISTNKVPLPAYAPPTNTPATPPQFPQVLDAFQKISTSASSEHMFTSSQYSTTSSSFEDMDNLTNSAELESKRT